MPKVNDDSNRAADRRGPRDDWRRSERVVRERWDEMRAAMRDAKQAGTEAWPEIRGALGDLRDALDLATKRFREIRARSAAPPAEPTPPALPTPPDLHLPEAERKDGDDPEC